MGFLPIVKHKAKFIMNQTYVDHKAYEWEGSYAYSTIVRGVLTPISRHNISLPIPKREIQGYKVPSTYTTNFLRAFSEKNKTPREALCEGKVPLDTRPSRGIKGFRLVHKKESKT
jgi:hypothetical protein